MPGVNNPLGIVQSFRLRVTKLDTNGVPTPAAGMMYVSTALVQATTTAIYKDGTEITQENGEGVLCVNWRGPATFQRLDGTITICTPDPYLMNFLAGCVVLDKGSGALGYGYPALGQTDPTNISIEMWSKRIDDGNLDSTEPYEWHVLPRVKNMRLTTQTFGNNAQVPVVNFEAYENEHWHDGPLNDWPVASDKVYQTVPWTSYPAASTNLQAVAAS